MIDYEKHYSGYYEDASLAHWRRLGAEAKAANIISLWAKSAVRTPPTVLDIGCGDGAVLEALARHDFGSTYTGVDISQSGLDLAAARSYGRPARFHRVSPDALDLDDHFDLAIMSHVLEHVAEPRRAVQEAARLARFVVIEVPLELHARTPRQFVWDATGHINLFNLTSARHLLQSAGLEVAAELTTSPSRAAMRHRVPGWRGNLRWAVKAAALRGARPLALQLWTYHATFLTRRVIE